MSALPIFSTLDVLELHKRGSQAGFREQNVPLFSREYKAEVIDHIYETFPKEENGKFSTKLQLLLE